MKTIIAPSLLAANFLNLQNEIEKINNSEAKWIHFDIMDGNFVPNISFGFPILEAIRPLTDKIIDCHLMIEKPLRYIERLIKAGANAISFHYESNEENILDIIHSIKSQNAICGIVINPDTSPLMIEKWIKQIDYILIMSINPGFGGQKFMESTYQKIIETKKLILKNNPNCKIQIDGGVNQYNSIKLRESGADILVSGSALFNAENFNHYILTMID